MPEARELLERVAHRISPPPDAFERLVRARRRRERNRRMAAGVLALVVAAAGVGALFVAFGGVPRVVLGGGAHRPFPGVWPGRTWEEAEAAQARADAGEDAWRLQPASVGYRFAEEVLGWGRPGTEVIVGEVATGGDRMLLRTHRFAARCGLGDARVGIPCPPIVAELELTVEQLIRRGEGGIWTVTGVDSPDIDPPVEPGGTVWIGQPVEIAMRPPADHLVLAAGWHLTAPGCPRWTGVATAPASDGRVVLTPDAFPEGCDPPVPAVLYAWIGERAGDLDPFLHPIQPTTLEAVRVVFDLPPHPVVTPEPSRVSAIPVVGTIRCGDASTAAPLVTPAVQPAEDGVHLTLVGARARRVVAQLLRGSEEWNIPLAAGRIRRLVLSDLPPGEYRVSCLPADPDAHAELRVVDPDGLWHAPELDCPGAVQVMEFDGTATGLADPTEAVRAFPGVKGSDVVEYAGYPLASDGFRVIRAGEVVALVHLERAQRGGWFVSSVESCVGSGPLSTPPG